MFETVMLVFWLLRKIVIAFFITILAITSGGCVRDYVPPPRAKAPANTQSNIKILEEVELGNYHRMARVLEYDGKKFLMVSQAHGLAITQIDEGK